MELDGKTIGIGAIAIAGAFSGGSGLVTATGTEARLEPRVAVLETSRQFDAEDLKEIRQDQKRIREDQQKILDTLNELKGRN